MTRVVTQKQVRRLLPTSAPAAGKQQKCSVLNKKLVKGLQALFLPRTAPTSQAVQPVLVSPLLIRPLTESHLMRSQPWLLLGLVIKGDHGVTAMHTPSSTLLEFLYHPSLSICLVPWHVFMLSAGYLAVFADVLSVQGSGVLKLPGGSGVRGDENSVSD